MSRSREWTRFRRRRAIGRKMEILRAYGSDAVKGWTRGRPGRLSKGKIHCSCRMCRRKSYDELSITDKRKELSARMERMALFREEIQGS